MTRAERIEAAARALARYYDTAIGPLEVIGGHVAELEAALASPAAPEAAPAGWVDVEIPVRLILDRDHVMLEPERVSVRLPADSRAFRGHYIAIRARVPLPPAPAVVQGAIVEAPALVAAASEEG
jgi:hypothetical protein